MESLIDAQKVAFEALVAGRDKMVANLQEAVQALREANETLYHYCEDIYGGHSWDTDDHFWVKCSKCGKENPKLDIDDDSFLEGLDEIE